MIAKVRIAPVEQWCDRYKRLTKFQCAAGRVIEIESTSMHMNDLQHDEPCKMWMLTVESKHDLEVLLGIKTGPFNYLLCEHVLEMD